MITTRPIQIKYSGNRAQIHRLFKHIACGVVLLFIILSGENLVVGQVRITGHVFAEIVEPTALSSKAHNSHLIETNNNNNNYELVLAEVILSGGQNMNIDFSVTTGKLVSTNGEILPFNSIACSGCFESNQSTIAGERIFTLKATPGNYILEKRNNSFSGGYSLVFMYN